MGIFKREGKNGTTYYVEFELNGQRVKRSARNGATRAEAKELETQLRKELQADGHARRVGKSLKKTFGQVLVEWLTGATGKIPDSRLKSHIRVARPYMENRPLEDGTAVSVEMKKAMLAEGLKPATINRRLQIVRQCLNIAHDDLKWITWSPHKDVEMLNEDNKREIYLTPAQVNALMKGCKACHPDAPRAIIMAAVSGLRRGELLSLPPERMAAGNVAVVLPSKSTKSKKPRRIPIPEPYRPLFNDLPLQLTYKQLRDSWVTAREAAGLQHVWFHDLRHTFASWLAHAGAHLQDIQELLGHADITTTMRYVTLVDGRHDHVVTKLPSVELPSAKGEAA